MKTIFVIQDIQNKEYYYRRGNIEGFSANIRDAKVYKNEESALEEIKNQSEWNTDLFRGRYFEIKKIHKLS